MMPELKRQTLDIIKRQIRVSSMSPNSNEVLSGHLIYGLAISNGIQQAFSDSCSEDSHSNTTDITTSWIIVVGEARA